VIKEKFIKNRAALITLIAASLVVLLSLGVRQTFGLFFMDFNSSLSISNTEFGLAIGIQMLMWGISGPIFGTIADKYGGQKAITIAFVFFILGVYLLYTGPNTGIFFQINLGLLVGIGLGGTAISIPMSIVGKHFPLSNRTIAMSIVTAVGSFGYFLSPLFTTYSLAKEGWESTLFVFTIFLLIGFFINSRVFCKFSIMLSCCISCWLSRLCFLIVFQKVFCQILFVKRNLSSSSSSKAC
jgi:MFS family permease